MILFEFPVMRKLIEIVQRLFRSFESDISKQSYEQYGRVPEPIQIQTKGKQISKYLCF